ncbi:formylglycine-generating enzyme family protein [Pseudoxanthomonas sp. LH2527]|uniref:formylglycine-generating enzyme family protein n=1 Tax=Pseudoxanthomonas sp. LH2527 TaxID=2923249 RepID=UPI001F148D66|nr:formylglycine-generating enzyme family protein [Pseudoxanthomonas sp. LH2527]MCH6484412.1 formylglycine-generating enzyme family protein [Pseudoxanthomonas sp. LH2527]
MPSVTVTGDDSAVDELNWRPPSVELAAEDVADAHRRAARALSEGHLFDGPDDAIPLYLALQRLDADDARARTGLGRSLDRLLDQGAQALRHAEDRTESLRRARQIAAVARTVTPSDPAVGTYLARVDEIDQLTRLNVAAERALREGALGEAGGGALAGFREVLKWKPGQARALQGIAAVESAMIRRAEEAALASDFTTARTWLEHAARVREDAQTVADARVRVEAIRLARIVELRDAGVRDMATPLGLKDARMKLAEVLRIAEPGNRVAADFRQRIDLATHYGLFRPGQAFTDALHHGGRGPEMVVVPHGGFLMGAADDEAGAADAEKPAHYVRFDRGFAMARHPVTVGEFRRFVEATQYRPRATRRGHSVVYDERSGNFVRRSGVDWRSDYAGQPASDDMPVLHVSVYDAEAYAEWLAGQTGHGYRLPSEAEFEYALRAGQQGRYPWGNGQPPRGIANLTGGNDRSPSGRDWNNAFVGYGDGYWGPAPAGRFRANAFGLKDLEGNTSEWVGDCWHASYRRAPADGAAWFNPGCRSRVVRGGSWASSPAQARAAWRSSSDSDMTNARVGFRVVRGI